MSEPVNLAKMASSWFTGTYWAKVVSYALGFIVLGFVSYAIYKAYIKNPEPTTDQNAESIINYNSQPRATFGCATVKTYEDYPVNGQITR